MSHPFHVEGFVNTFRLADTSGQKPGVVAFDSGAFENFNSAWKARETYDFVTDDEFVETFDLAPPGQPYKTYSHTEFKRVSRWRSRRAPVRRTSCGSVA